MRSLALLLLLLRPGAQAAVCQRGDSSLRVALPASGAAGARGCCYRAHFH